MLQAAARNQRLHLLPLPLQQITVKTIVIDRPVSRFNVFVVELEVGEVLERRFVFGLFDAPDVVLIGQRLRKGSYSYC